MSVTRTLTRIVAAAAAIYMAGFVLSFLLFLTLSWMGRGADIDGAFWFATWWPLTVPSALVMILASAW